jgi:Arabinose efflux permease
MDSMPALSHARDLRSDATRILTLTTLQQIGLTMVRFGLPVLLPFMREDLRLSVLQVAIVLTALDLGSLVAFIPAGLITDRWGERRVLVSGGLLMGVVAAATALAPSLAFLLIGLAIAGLGFPSGHTAGTKLVVRRFAPQARGLALGIRMSGLPAGGALAALLIPSLAGMWGWRGALAVIGGLCALVAALCLFLPRDREVPGHPLPTALAPLRALVAEPRYVHLTAMGALLVIGQFTLQGFLALFLVDQYGWAPSDAGRLLAVVHVGGVAGRLLWGRFQIVRPMPAEHRCCCGCWPAESPCCWASAAPPSGSTSGLRWARPSPAVPSSPDGTHCS